MPTKYDKQFIGVPQKSIGDQLTHDEFNEITTALYNNTGDEIGISTHHIAVSNPEGYFLFTNDVYKNNDNFTNTEPKQYFAIAKKSGGNSDVIFKTTYDTYLTNLHVNNIQIPEVNDWRAKISDNGITLRSYDTTKPSTLVIESKNANNGFDPLMYVSTEKHKMNTTDTEAFNIHYKGTVKFWDTVSFNESVAWNSVDSNTNVTAKNNIFVDRPVPNPNTLTPNTGWVLCKNIDVEDSINMKGDLTIGTGNNKITTSGGNLTISGNLSAIATTGSSSNTNYIFSVDKNNLVVNCPTNLHGDTYVGKALTVIGNTSVNGTFSTADITTNTGKINDLTIPSKLTVGDSSDNDTAVFHSTAAFYGKTSIIGTGTFTCNPQGVFENGINAKETSTIKSITGVKTSKSNLPGLDGLSDPEKVVVIENDTKLFSKIITGLANVYGYEVEKENNETSTDIAFNTSKAEFSGNVTVVDTTSTKDLTATGNITGVTATLTGKLTGVSAEFSGEDGVKVTNTTTTKDLTATGNINGVTATLTGKLTGVSAEFSGEDGVKVTNTTTTKDLTISNLATTKDLTATGNITGVTATLTGKLTGVSAEFSGEDGVKVTNTTTTKDLTISNLATTKDLTVTNATSTKDLTVSNLATTKDLTATGNITGVTATLTGKLTGATAEFKNGTDTSFSIANTGITVANTTTTKDLTVTNAASIKDLTVPNDGTVNFGSSTININSSKLNGFSIKRKVSITEGRLSGYTEGTSTHTAADINTYESTNSIKDYIDARCNAIEAGLSELIDKIKILQQSNNGVYYLDIPVISFTNVS